LAAKGVIEMDGNGRHKIKLARNHTLHLLRVIEEAGHENCGFCAALKQRFEASLKENKTMFLYGRLEKGGEKQ